MKHRKKLNRFYNLFEQSVTILFEKKESFKSEEEKKHKPGNKIPKRIRILMRKKTSISKKINTLNSPTRTLRLMKLLDTIETDLRTSYKSMKIKKENEALSKIKNNPKHFYKFANSFSKIKNQIGPLIDNKGEMIKDSFLMAEILRKQYDSTFSTPRHDSNIDNLGDFFDLMV